MPEICGVLDIVVIKISLVMSLNLEFHKYFFIYIGSLKLFIYYFIVQDVSGGLRHFVGSKIKMQSLQYYNYSLRILYFEKVI